MSRYTIPPLLCLAAYSGYGLWLSYQNITRLQQYEERTKKAAEWSNTAAERLHKTRTTQGSTAITIALSLVTGLGLALIPHAEHHNITFSIALVNTATLFAARIHAQNFWHDKAKVPFMTGYNEAISGTGQTIGILGLLGMGWVGVGVFGWLLG